VHEPTVIHGNAMVIDGHGVLITGDSGSGKTELCVDLLKRGHHIIADDAVALSSENNHIIASAPTTTHDQIALSPQGIESISKTFGVRALVNQHLLHFHVALDDSHRQYSRCHLVNHLKQLPVDPETINSAEVFELLVRNAIRYKVNNLQEAPC
jgi:HPr kinase/phosphorylase